MVGLLAWSWAAPGRWLGPLAGVLAVVRIFSGSLAVQRVRATGWRGALAPLAVAAALVLVTLPLFGLHSWTDYLNAVANAVPGCNKAVNSLACYVTPVTGAGLAKTLTLVFAGVLIVAALIVRSPLASFTLVALAWVVPLPDLSPHYLLALFLPVYIVAARKLRRVDAPRQPTAQRLGETRSSAVSDEERAEVEQRDPACPRPAWKTRGRGLR